MNITNPLFPLLCVNREVRDDTMGTFRLLPQQTNSGVAAVAEQRTDLAGGVFVVDVERVVLASVPTTQESPLLVLADRAHAGLGVKHRLVLGLRNTVAVLEVSLAIESVRGLGSLLRRVTAFAIRTVTANRLSVNRHLGYGLMVFTTSADRHYIFYHVSAVS